MSDRPKHLERLVFSVQQTLLGALLLGGSVLNWPSYVGVLLATLGCLALAGATWISLRTYLERDRVTAVSPSEPGGR